MAAYTAYLLIGGVHQNQDGIIADKMVYLSENGILKTMNLIWKCA